MHDVEYLLSDFVLMQEVNLHGLDQVAHDYYRESEGLDDDLDPRVDLPYLLQELLLVLEYLQGERLLDRALVEEEASLLVVHHLADQSVVDVHLELLVVVLYRVEVSGFDYLPNHWLGEVLFQALSLALVLVRDHQHVDLATPRPHPDAPVRLLVRDRVRPQVPVEVKCLLHMHHPLQVPGAQRHKRPPAHH